jgi:hypothetical protein
VQINGEDCRVTWRSPKLVVLGDDNVRCVLYRNVNDSGDEPLATFL